MIRQHRGQKHGIIVMKVKSLDTGHGHINRRCKRVLLDNVRLSSTVLMTELSRSTDHRHLWGFTCVGIIKTQW